MLSVSRVVVLLLLLAACAPVAPAQTGASLARDLFEPKRAEAEELAAGSQTAGGPFGLEKSVNEYGVWGSISPDSPTLIGGTQDARLAILGLRYARILARGEHVALKYTVDAVPFASLSFPWPEPSNLSARKRITGAGLAPVGFQVNFRRREKWQPFAQASGGFIYFGERVPDRDGAQFNFTADFGGGVQWKAGARRAWTIGYRYQHLSNGYRAGNNPGFDANLFYVGYSIYR